MAGPTLWIGMISDDFPMDPAQTYPDAIFAVRIPGTIEALGKGGFAGVTLG